MLRRLSAPVLALLLILPGAALAASPSQPAGPPDLAVVRATLVGTWQSSDDTRFTRELDADGQATDRHEGDDAGVVNGHWMLFLGSAPPADMRGRKLVPGAVYLRLQQNDDVLVYGLVSLSSADLKMVYLEGGNVLSFMRLK